MKSNKQTFLIENAHQQLIRDIDFNPNKQYYLASCGDDCKTKFWDTRKPNECLKTISNHSHWYDYEFTLHSKLIIDSKFYSFYFLNNYSIPN